MTTLPDMETLTRELARLEGDERTLDERRALVRGQIITTRKAITRAQDEQRVREREPADLRELERVTSELRRRLDGPMSYPGDSTSHTRERVRRELDQLHNKGLSTHDRLGVARRLLQDFRERYRLDLNHWAGKGKA